MQWDPVLKLFLLKKSTCGSRKQCMDPHTKKALLGNAQNALPKWRCNIDIATNGDKFENFGKKKKKKPIPMRNLWWHCQILHYMHSKKR